MSADILIVTNGFRGTWPAIRYGAWAAKTLGLSATLLGVREETDERHPLEDLCGEAVRYFNETGVSYRLETEEGQTEEVLKPRTARGDAAMVVLGPLGRPQIRRWVMGRSFRHIMAELDLPLLYVPQERLPVRRVLVCLGGLGHAVTARHWGLRIAREVGAEVAFLHVVQQMDLDYPETRKILGNLEHLADTDTLPGRELREGLSAAHEAGLQAFAHVRQGNPVHEISKEISAGDYDLACMGSAYSARGLRPLYTPNVTAEVAEAAHCPILTAR